MVELLLLVPCTPYGILRDGDNMTDLPRTNLKCLCFTNILRPTLATHHRQSGLGQISKMTGSKCSIRASVLTLENDLGNPPALVILRPTVHFEGPRDRDSPFPFLESFL